MEKYKFIIVDDEFPLHLTMKNHLKPYPKYEFVKSFFDPEEALIFLKDNHIDLIFLDIKMPKMNGFQFLEALNKPVFVVILTAYQEEYSLDAHHYYMDKDLVFFSNKAQIGYYLPKIIARFEKMYEERKIVNRVNQLAKNEIDIFPKKTNGISIAFADIVLIEVIGHNIVLKMNNQEEFVFRMTFRKLISFLPQKIFFQIKRNLIINIGYVTAFTETTVCIAEQHYTISSKIKTDVIQTLNKQKQILCKNN